MRAQYRAKRGLSLLELLAVVTVMGIMAGVVMARHGRTLFSNFGSQADTRRLSLAMVQAKRRAITNGNEHAVVLASSGGVTTFSVVSIDAGGAVTLVDGPMAFSPDVVVTSSHAQLRFNFEGQAGGAYWVQMVAPKRTWRIDVVPINGSLSISDVRT